MVSASATISSSSIADRFTTLRAAHRRALVVYVTAGHPTIDASRALIGELADAGADIIEVGAPFSDPLADGPTIQASSQRALENGMTLGGALDLVRDVRPPVPTVLFTYLNPLLSAGPDVLARAAAAGVSGVLVTDLPLGADPAREQWIARSELDFIRLVAPTTPADRISEIARHGGGFVYVISRLGVTGARAELAADVGETVMRVRSATELPICVGFGVSTPAQAASVARIADGVVVGSAIVEAAERGADRALELVAALRRGIDNRES